ncbi:MAG TPA: ACT domain-containing protein [Desulfobacterales bacterium]|nr:ACT domain-containing protein [Desulfobacterales bacterium]
MAGAYAVLTAIGADRVGIVDDVSGLVAARSCNIEESRMAVLGGEFALIMLVSGAAPQIDLLGGDLAGAGERTALHLQLAATREPRTVEGRPYLLETVSLDTPGIVHTVTAVLRRHGVNIENLETDTAPAPWTGAPMFRMRAHVVVGPRVEVARLKDDLARLEVGQDLDVSLRPVFPVPPSE